VSLQEEGRAAPLSPLELGDMNGAATGVNVRDEAVGGENRGVAGPCEGADVRAGCQRVRSVEEGLHVRCAACSELRDPIRPS
jgi:hypothetical protein